MIPPPHLYLILYPLPMVTSTIEDDTRNNEKDGKSQTYQLEEDTTIQNTANIHMTLNETTVVSIISVIIEEAMTAMIITLLQEHMVHC